MDPVTVDLFDRHQAARQRLYRRGFAARSGAGAATVASVTALIAGIRLDGPAAWASLGAMLTAITLLGLAARVRTDDLDDDIAALDIDAVGTIDNVRRVLDTQLQAIGRLLELQATYLTGAGLAIAAAIAIVIAAR